MPRSLSRHRWTRLHTPVGLGRLIGACVLALSFLLVNTGETSASIGWCRSDPVLQIDDALADVFVSIPLETVLQVTGPTRFVITTPREIDSAVLLTSPGFGYGEIVTINQSPALKVLDTGIQLRIKVYVPATSASIPVIVDFAPRIIGIVFPVTAEGTTNGWITLNTTL